MCLLFFLILFIQYTSKTGSDIFSQLEKYELFQRPSFRISRDVDGQQTRQTVFYAWGRSWYLILHREASFLNSNLSPLSDYKSYIGNNSMLMYRLRDIQIKKILNNSMNYKSGTLLALGTDTFDAYVRRKRSNPIHHKLCRLTLIVDYAFFANLGNRSGPKTISHVAFSRFDVKQSCLAHLLSYKRIDDGILGMSWLASPDPKKLGGICSPPLRKNNKRNLYLNTGWTTYVDYNGQQLVNALAELITAHELGHSWGADHDPDTNECNPTATSSGKYLMYTYSVSGYAENNGKFSPCSLRTIGACLVTRAPICFDDSSMALSNLCGNSRIDVGEECDAGRNPHDPCCSSKCLLRKGARCSPWNHGCCTSDCQLAPRNTICAHTSSTNPCLGPGQCNGLSSICPGPTLLSGSQCAEHGRCFQGKCHPFCYGLGLETCICDAGQITAELHGYILTGGNTHCTNYLDL
ncbi:ADAM 17-like protease [Schistosoma japonicum]|nr:ADAM 17-like protease [Schistosoma japonicum]KAH8859623.1 ADAM 17-like protease [Schistosoma japonicum]